MHSLLQDTCISSIPVFHQAIDILDDLVVFHFHLVPKTLQSVDVATAKLVVHPLQCIALHNSPAKPHKNACLTVRLLETSTSTLSNG